MCDFHVSLPRSPTLCSQHQSQVPPRDLCTGWAAGHPGVLCLWEVSTIEGTRVPWDWAEFHFKAPQKQEGSRDERGQNQQASTVLVTQQTSPTTKRNQFCQEDIT